MGEYNKVEYNRKYNDSNYERVLADINKEKGVAFKAICKQEKLSQAAILEECVTNFLKKYNTLDTKEKEIFIKKYKKI